MVSRDEEVKDWSKEVTMYACLPWALFTTAPCFLSTPRSWSALPHLPRHQEAMKPPDWLELSRATSHLRGDMQDVAL